MLLAISSVNENEQMQRNKQWPV